MEIVDYPMLVIPTYTSSVPTGVDHRLMSFLQRTNSYEESREMTRVS